MPRHERDQREKGAWRFLGLKRVLAANAAVFAIVSWGITGEFLRNRDMQKELDRLETLSEQAAKQNERLEDMGKRFSSDAMLEREARTKLNLQRPGEQVVVVRASGAANPAGAAGEPSQEPDRGGAASNYTKWWHYFFP